MDSLLKYKWFILAFFSIAVLYFIFRLPNLTAQPIFADEAIYIHWSQLMRSEASLRFISMTDGKTPLYMWILIPFLKIFNDPLFAGRFLSVIFGFGTLIGTIILSLKFFNKRVAVWSGMLLAITPFMVFFDRMALVDSMLTTFMLWTLLLVLLLQRYARLDIALIGGFLAGFSVLTKTPGSIIGYLLPFSFIAMPTKGKVHSLFIKRALLLLTMFLMMQIMFNLLRLGPGFENLHSRDQDYIFSVREVISHPLNPLQGNILRVAAYLSGYLGYGILLFTFLGIFLSVKKLDRNAIAVLIWGGLCILVAAMFIKPFTARYILFGIPPLLIITAIGIDEICQRYLSRNKFFIALLLVIVASYPVYFNMNLLTDVYKTPKIAEEYSGYFREWTAGVGLREIAAYLQTKTQEGTVVVGTEGAFGTLPNGLQIYFDRNRKIVFQGGNAVITDGLRTAAIEHQAFFVSNKSRFDGKDISGIELIKEYDRPARDDGTKDAILLFKVYPLDGQATISAKLKQ